MEATARRQNSRFLPLTSSADWGGRCTRAEVNLDAIQSNVATLRKLSSAGHLMAVVKGNGYGHGATQIARTALSSGATWLGVYCVEEGVALRRDGISAPILVFGPLERGEAEDIWSYQLTPTIATLEAAAALQDSSHGRTLQFHLKIDTGLTRAGIAPHEAIPFMQRLRQYPALEPKGLFTHFASADEPAKDPARKQLAIFLDTAGRLADAGFTFPIKHAANSAATLELPESHLDMVRVGISLYGHHPCAEPMEAVPLHPALSLVSKIIRLQAIAPGTGVGYGHHFRAPRRSIVALVPIGYGDGLPRRLGGGRGRVLVRGRFAPIVGRISMDQITVNVTDILDVSLGDPVTLIGSQDSLDQTADDLADQAGTISYEILTALLPRVPRIFVSQKKIVGTLGLISPAAGDTSGPSPRSPATE